MRYFSLTSYGSDFFTGVTSDGRQVILGLLCPNLLSVYFDASGKYLSHDVHSLTMQPPRMGVSRASWETAKGIEDINGVRPGPFKIYDPKFQSSLAKDLDGLRHRIGFTERPIRVQQFKVDGQSVGIELLPWHLAEFKANPASVAESKEELHELQADLAEWENATNFVFHWAKDYWCGLNGEVEST